MESKTRNTVRVQYEVRAINADGDAIDILAWCGTFQQAVEYAPDITGETVAWVIERHNSYCARGRPDVYETVASDGDVSALKMGGWISEETTR